MAIDIDYEYYKNENVEKMDDDYLDSIDNIQAFCKSHDIDFKHYCMGGDYLKIFRYDFSKDGILLTKGFSQNDIELLLYAGRLDDYFIPILQGYFSIDSMNEYSLLNYITDDDYNIALNNVNEFCDLNNIEFYCHVDPKHYGYRYTFIKYGKRYSIFKQFDELLALMTTFKFDNYLITLIKENLGGIELWQDLDQKA